MAVRLRGCGQASRGTKTGVPGRAKMQFRNRSCSRISGNGPPLAVSAMSHLVTGTPIASHRSAAPVPTRPRAPMTMARGRLHLWRPARPAVQRSAHPCRDRRRPAGIAPPVAARPMFSVSRQRPHIRPNSQKRQPGGHLVSTRYSRSYNVPPPALNRSSNARPECWPL